MTAMKPSSAPKQQFILTRADSSGAGKVILASPDSHHTKQLLFTATDTLMPGRIQVQTRPPPPPPPRFIWMVPLTISYNPSNIVVGKIFALR